MAFESFDKNKNMKLSIVIILLPLCAQVGYSQQKIRLSKYKKMSRDSIISIALNIVDKGTFEDIDPLKHKYTSVKICRKKVLVEFRNPVVFLSKGESFVRTIQINVSEKQCMYICISFNEEHETIAFCSFFDKKLTFYKEAETKKKKLEPILEKLDKRRDLLVSDFYSIDNNLIIREYKDRYDIHNYSSTHDSYFSINKKTWEIENGFSTYALDPVYYDKSNCTEIK